MLRIHRFPMVTVLMALLLALAAGCDSPSAKAQAEPQAQAAPPEVGVVALASQSVSLTTTLTGRTSPYLVAQVRPQVGGIIQKRLFTEGAEVKAGQQLYQIDPATYQAAYDTAKAEVAKAEANVVNTRLKAKRFAELASTGAVSDQENDDAQAALRQAEAELQATKAALESARIDLAHTTITSPIAGRIGASSVTPGALVTANQATALATVQQIDPIYVYMTQSSRELLRLRRAFAEGRLTRSGSGLAAVKLLYEDDSPYPLPGSLEFADITVDQDTGVITLRALFPNPNRDLLPGMYVRGVLEEGVAKEALLVPQEAVSRDPKGNASVLVALPDDTLEQRAVVLDRVVGDAWLVTSGLSAGDRVVVEGLQKVRPGMKVRAVPAGSSARQ